MNNVKMTDVSQILNSVQSPINDYSKQYISKFDIIQAPRSEVKHYPLDDTIDNTSEEPFDEILSNKLINASHAIWMTFNQEVVNIVPEKGSIYDLLNSDGKIGVIKVCTPHRFDTVDTKVNELKAYSITYEDGNFTRIRSEINFTIELY